MIRRVFLAAITAALLGACSTYYDAGNHRLQSLSQHYSQFDLRLAWDTRVAGGETFVEGVAKNVRYAFMYDLEIWVAVLNPDGKVAARSVSYVIPRRLDLDQSTEFRLKLPVAVVPGTRLHFTYKYRGSEGGEGFGGGLERGTDWMQSFDAVVP